MATLTETLTNLGNAIREKTGGTDAMTLAEMATAVAGISTGGNISGVSEFDSGTITTASSSYTYKLELNYSLSAEPDFFIIAALTDAGTTSNTSRVLASIALKYQPSNINYLYYYIYPICMISKTGNASNGTSTLYIPCASRIYKSSTYTADGFPTNTSATLYMGSNYSMKTTDSSAPYSNYARTLSSTSATGTMPTNTCSLSLGTTYYWIAGVLG